MNAIQELDETLLRFFNQSISNPIFDSFFPFITNVDNWLLVYVFLIGWLLWKGGRTGRFAAVTLLITITVSDQLNSEILKEIFGRLRPCKVLDDINLLVNCGSGKSFPSSHAVNNFAAAIVLSRYYDKYKYVYFTIAGLMAFSRVYVGVHYPFDVLTGALIGVLVGYLIVSLSKYLENRAYGSKGPKLQK